MHAVMKIVLGCTPMLGSVAVAEQAAEPAPAPIMKVGDTWTFEKTIETGTSGFARVQLKNLVERVSGDSMLVGVKQEGSPGGYEDHQVGTDWSLRVLANGAEMITARPFSFPMTPGQSWVVDYKNQARFGRQVGLHAHRTYKVDGWEEVRVPAGTFQALKIETNGVDQFLDEIPQVATSGIATSPSGTAAAITSQRGGYVTITQRHFAEIYYVPKVKNFVKIVEEQYNENDVRVSRQTQTLAAFTPGT